MNTLPSTSRFARSAMLLLAAWAFCLGASAQEPATRVPVKDLSDKECRVYGNALATFPADGAATILRLEYGTGNGTFGGGWFAVPAPNLDDAQCRGVALTVRGNGKVPGKSFLFLKMAAGGAYRSRDLGALFVNPEWNEVVLSAADFIVDPNDKSEASKTLPPRPMWTDVRRIDISAVNVEAAPTIEFKAIAFATGDAAPTAAPIADAARVHGPAPTGDAWEPAWGFWPKAPTFWHPTHEGMVKQVRQGPANIIFVGDSITKGWTGAGKEIWQARYAPLGAVNIGIGGDTTRQILWRIDHEALDGAKPKLIILMIGVNNIFTATGSNEDIARGVEEILKRCQAKCPKAKILLLGILPLGNARQNARVQEINQMLAKFQGDTVRFLDLQSQCQDGDGKVRDELYSPDQVHLATQGYETWAATMQPVLDEMLK